MFTTQVQVGTPHMLQDKSTSHTPDPAHGQFKASDKYYNDYIDCLDIMCILHSIQVDPKPIELVPGYGVYLTQKQLDAAVGNSNNSPTRLIRSLMSTFFTPDVLASSSACGTRRHKALDSDIVQACIRKFSI